MKKILAVATFSALALVACGDSSSDSVPTTGTPSDDIYGPAWVSQNTPADRVESLTFTRTGVANFAKMKKYVTCSDNRFSVVETDVNIGAKSLTIANDVSGNNDQDCQAKIAKGNYTYQVTPSDLKMQATSGDKKQIEYKRKGVYSCMIPNFFEKGNACADYYNNSITIDKCGSVFNGQASEQQTCDDRAGGREIKQICRYRTNKNGKDLDFVLKFYDQAPNCSEFPVSFHMDLVGE